MDTLTKELAEQLTKERGYSLDILRYLRDQKLIGTHEGNIAFATTGGCHYRVKDGSWRYSKGAKPSPFMLGPIDEGAHVHCFESPWDAIAFADSAGEHSNIVATRGAGNAKLVVDAVGKDYSGTLYLWPQNDKPGQKWAEDVRRLFPGQMKLAAIPHHDKEGTHKDLCEWRKHGATNGDVFNAMIEARDYNLSGSGDGSSNSRLGPSRSRKVDAPPAQNNLTAVPVLAESHKSQNSGIHSGGEVRESIKTMPLESVKPKDSRGGSQFTLAQALDATIAFLKRYVVFVNEAQVIACALWCAHTHIYDAFDFSPILYISAPDSGCGKSTLLDCIELLVARPSKCSSTSDASFLREIDQIHPTVLMDEVDNFLTDEKSPLVGAINDGFKRGAKAKKCADFGEKIIYLDIYSPKALTGIGKVQKSLHSRSIEIRLTRESKGTGTKFRTRRVGNLAKPIRESFEAWAKEAKPILMDVEPELPDDLEGRQQDLIESMAAIADLAGGGWPEQGRDALRLLFTTRGDRSTGEQLLSSCRDIFRYHDKLTTAELLERLIKIEDAVPWATWWENDVMHNHIGRPSNKLAALLSPYGITSANMRVKVDGRDKVLKGYYKESFLEAWAKYLPKEDREPKTLELGLVA